MLTLHREVRMPTPPAGRCKTPLRIDAHQHFWRYRSEDYPWIGAGMDLLAQDRLPYQFQPLLEAQGLHASITVQARQGRDETAFLLEMARRDKRIAGIIGWEDLSAPDLAEQMERWGRHKLLGLRHQLQEHDDANTLLTPAPLDQGVRWLQERSYTLDVLAHERHLPQLRQFCARHDQHWVVLNHLGKPALKEFRKGRAAFERWRQELRELTAMPHVACKISGLLTEADWLRGLCTRDFEHIVQCLDTALDLFGPQRLMFGSDWPVCLLAASYSRVVTVVREWSATRLCPSDQDALWGESSARIYGLLT
ncbi:amidohydrolase family protein [Herbaspirillum seropedicae]|nr:amidohydrolase family protein [Herbaspirillum seropedicae]AKN67746.1 amidohydrolase [Herbaspirillum seropedicae]AON56877.1 metal-dependent hydrolase [Herbaspirillum seropedicae]NQE29784.1 amidohydrolase [Herbaspirillum seropedicae]UMU23768.1 amidohydrolase family protein [Herbaspirillum seropedicae]